MGFFLPGDSLLFVAGIMWRDLETGFFNVPFVLIMVLIAIAAILGNQVGYWFGRRIGPAMYTWRDRWYFKQRYLQQARKFYEDHGNSAIFLARFIPFVRNGVFPARRILLYETTSDSLVKSGQVVSLVSIFLLRKRDVVRK